MFSNKRNGVTKISERKAREPLPKPFRTPEQIEKEFDEMIVKRQSDTTKGGATAQKNTHDPLYEDCFGDGGFGDGGFGGDMGMDLDDGYSGDNDGGDDEEEEEEESLENMPLYEVEEHFKPVFKKGVFRRFAKKRTYAEAKRQRKRNWTEFIDCVAGDLAWCPLGAGVQPCDCKESILLPALSWNGTKT